MDSKSADPVIDANRRIRIDEQEIHLKLTRCNVLLENINEAYFENDLNNVITFTNENGCRLLGKTSVELLGTKFSEHLHPDTAKHMVGVYKKIFKTGQRFKKNDYIILSPDGTYKTHELVAGLIKDRSDSPVGFYSIVKDTTEDAINRESIKIKEDRYRNILDSMEESYFEVDLKGNILFFNNTVLKDLGYTREEMVGMNFRQMVDKENSEILYKAFNRVYETGESIKGITWTIIKKNGDTIPVEASVALNRDEDGSPAGFRGVVRDITDRKISDEASRESMEKYKSILDSMEESYFEEDLHGNFTFFNESFIKHYGYSREELLGMNYRETLTPEFAELAKKVWTEIYNTGESRHVNNYEIIRKDGDILYLDLYTSLLRSKDGNPVGFWGVGRNITEQLKSERALRESERRYRMITQNMHDVIWTMDMDFKLTYLSPSVFRVFGYTPEELTNIPLVDYLMPEAKEKVLHLVEIINNKSGVDNLDPHASKTYEINMKKKDESIITAEVTASFIIDDNEKITGILGITRDITERNKADEERKHLEAQLLQSQKMESVGRLAGGVAHDFNNMLSVIIGYIELIKFQMPRSDPLYNDILEIEKASMRSRDITAQLLAFSRKQVISPTVIDLNNQIEGIRKTLSRLLGEDLELNFIPADDLWPIKFDSSQAEQVLVNLAVNARDAMRNGGTLTIETRNTVVNTEYCRGKVGISPGEFVELIVSDTGSGIDEENLQYIFEPFFTTKEIGTGTGLGLATVYGIVTQNGGFIDVYSETGMGTVFKVYFPRSMEGIERRPVSDEHVTHDTGHILLVEDDLMVRKMVTDMLETIGYSVVAPVNPVEAIHYCKKAERSVDLVITDVIMPVMSGRDLRDNLLAINPDLKVLFMSGYTADVIVHHGVLEEEMFFIQKPFNMKDLAVKVREAMSG